MPSLTTIGQYIFIYILIESPFRGADPTFFDVTLIGLLVVLRAAHVVRFPSFLQPCKEVHRIVDDVARLLQQIRDGELQQDFAKTVRHLYPWLGGGGRGGCGGGNGRWLRHRFGAKSIRLRNKNNSEWRQSQSTFYIVIYSLSFELSFF